MCWRRGKRSFDTDQINQAHIGYVLPPAHSGKLIWIKTLDGGLMRLSMDALLLLGALPVASQQAPPAVAVGTVAAERKPIAQSLEFVDRVDAIDRDQGSNALM
jgi:hypothetical protein